MLLDSYDKKAFTTFIWDFYQKEGRSFAWRNIDNPYEVVVSEIMLQQTQTHRVAPKYTAFITKFPSFKSLADAPLRDLLAAWQGLGYNRRALALQKIAQRVTYDFNGQLPADPERLETFPGIGAATAGSICAFAFNMPTIFIETNIRTVFIHSFFRGKKEVHDKELMPLIEQTVDKKNPREWYYALMDYGVYLKQKYPNPSRKSKHHTKQSKFEGSDRQIRGAIVRLMTEFEVLTESEITTRLQKEKERVLAIIDQLTKEKFLNKKDNLVTLYSK